MTLDPQELQKLMELHIQAATVNTQLSTLYAQLLAREPVSAAAPAEQAQVAQSVQTPLEAEQVQPVSVSLQVAEPAAADKPPAQSVAVAGIDMSKLGLSKSGSAIAWEVLIAHPPFQMFMSESGFPNPQEKDATELAVDFIIESSKSKAELAFYAEYATWFKNKGYWPNETPFGKPISDVEKV